MKIKSIIRDYTKYGAILGVLYGFFHMLGQCIQVSQNGQLLDVSNMGIFPLLFQFISRSIVWSSIFSILYTLINLGQSNNRNSFLPKTIFIKKFMMLLPFYFICYMVYFPGCMSYDAGIITEQAFGITPFNNHHPFLHTIIWTFFAHLDGWSGIRYLGIVSYTVLQVLIMVSIYSYALYWIECRQMAQWKKVLCNIYYALNPVFHIFTLVVTKDVLFSGFFLLFIIIMIEFQEAIECQKNIKHQENKLLIITLLTCLFRNNMVYVILVYLLMLLLLYKKRVFYYRSMFMAVAFYYLITGIIYPAFGVGKGNIREMLSVPISQVAAVCKYKPDAIREDEWWTIEKFIPKVTEYNEYFADDIKDSFNGDEFREHPGEFIKVWGKLLMREPGVYVRAFLVLNLPYWYTGMEGVREYIETGNTSSQYKATRTMWFPRLYEFYESVGDNNASFMRLPVFRQIYSIGMPIWILLFFMLGMIMKRKKGVVLAITPCLLLWLTYLLGPVSNFRYVEPLMLLYPIWFAVMADFKDNNMGNYVRV